MCKLMSYQTHQNHRLCCGTRCTGRLNIVENYVFQKSTWRVFGIWLLLSYIVTFTSITSTFFRRYREDFFFFPHIWATYYISPFIKLYVECCGLNKTCFHSVSLRGLCRLKVHIHLAGAVYVYPGGSKLQLPRKSEGPTGNRKATFVSDYTQWLQSDCLGL